MSTPAPAPDALILGSGIAGLTAGALLAHAGQRVRVLEAHYHPGGYGHTFHFGEGDDRIAFNAQLHYVWNCGPGETVDRMLRKLGLHTSVTFERYDPDGFDRMEMPGHSLRIPMDWGELVERLQGAFPAHAQACADFIAEVRGTEDELGVVARDDRPLVLLAQAHKLRRVLRYRDATLQDVFDRFGLPQAAQTLLALQWPDFLEPPNRLSFFAWVMLFAGYVQGAWYPTRHFEHFVDSLVQTIEQNGGEVRLRRRVVDFVSEGEAIVGVVEEAVDDKGEGTGALTTHRVARGGRVICNFDPRRAAEMIGVERFSGAVRRTLDYTYSASNFMAYVVVKGIDLRDYGFGRYNLFHTDDVDLNRCFHHMYRLGDYSKVSFAMTTPSLLTDVGGDCPEGQQIVEFLTVADHARFSALKFSDPRAYRRLKQRIFDAILDVVERDYVPGFREHICFKMTGSPTTNERYCLSPMGHSYGSAMTPAQIRNRVPPDSSIPGLYFCSATAGFAGFSGAVWTGTRMYERLTGDSVAYGPHLAGVGPTEPPRRGLFRR